MTERVAVVAWAGGEVRGEVLAHRDLAAEARAAGHLGEGVVGEFEEFLGGGDALGDEPVQGGGSGGGLEVAGEGAGDMPATGGQGRDGVGLVEVGEGVGADVGQGVGVAVGTGVGCSMNWAWVPVRKGAVTIARAMAAAASAPWAVRTRWRQRSIPAAVPAEVQTPVSSTKRASGSTWIAGWRAARVLARCQWVTARRPSRSPARASTKAPSAERGDRGARGVGAAEGVEYLGRDCGVGVLDAGDEDQIGGGEVVEPGERAVGGEGETAAQGDGGVRVGGCPAEFEGWDAAEGAVAAPDLGDDGDVEGADAREGEEGDALGAGRGCLRHGRHGWQ